MNASVKPNVKQFELYGITSSETENPSQNRLQASFNMNKASFPLMVDSETAMHGMDCWLHWWTLSHFSALTHFDSAFALRVRCEDGSPPSERTSTFPRSVGIGDAIV